MGEVILMGLTAIRSKLSSLLQKKKGYMYTVKDGHNFVNHKYAEVAYFNIFIKILT